MAFPVTNATFNVRSCHGKDGEMIDGFDDDEEEEEDDDDDDSA
jgi:hypothetical protein